MSTGSFRLSIGCLVAGVMFMGCGPARTASDDRQEVLFWHFWGGEDRQVVEKIVEQFNASQTKHVVRAIAMPGNNLDLKLFLAIAGKDPPDLVNQDDPVIGDWARRDTLMAIDDIIDQDELDDLHSWLLPAARDLGSYDGRLFGVANGLDVRAMYYNQTLLEEHGFQPPRTIDELDDIAKALGPQDSSTRADRFGFLPNPKLLWSWGIVFGGSFFDEKSKTVTVADKGIVAALRWMAGYGRRYGQAAVSFRAANQSLPGKVFPLTAGRYAMIVGGQWRIRDIRDSQQAQAERGQPVTAYGVTALPSLPGGRANAGWINGNLFLVPNNSSNPAGAWEFMKFWIGFGQHEDRAAQTCIAGGWIPVSQHVVETRIFQDFLNEEPLMRTFVELAASPNQRPRPNVPGAPLIDRELKTAAGIAMYHRGNREVKEVLEEAERRIRQFVDAESGRKP